MATRRPSDRYDVCESYLASRIRALRMPPAVIGVKLSNDKQVYSAVVDIPMGPNSLGTLVCLSNGSAVIYLNNGGVISNLSQRHPGLAQSVRVFIASAGQSLAACEKTSVFDLPLNGPAHYVHLMTRKGVYKTTINPVNLDPKTDQMKIFLLRLYQQVMNEIRNAQLVEQQNVKAK
ncbi:MAG: hypothetical protein Q4F95_16055 [Oscillospiraceae bacterium]|nr:hypothetical protein [Oscillospiraceae bacterium]